MGILRFWDFALTRFANVTGATLPRRQQVDIIGFEGEDSPTLNRILLRVTASDSLYSSALHARPGQFDGERVRTVGFSSAGDGGDGHFRYYGGSSNRTSPDGFTRINTDDGLGQYRYLDQGSIKPELCGAKGDGATDDRAAIQAAINTGLVVTLDRSSTYLVAKSGSYCLHVLSGTKLYGNGATIKLASAQGAAPVIVTYTYLGTTETTGVEIVDLVIDGNTDNQTMSAFGPTLYLNNISASKVENVTVKNGSWYGLYANEGVSGTIHDNKIDKFRIEYARGGGFWAAGSRWTIGSVYTDNTPYFDVSNSQGNPFIVNITDSTIGEIYANNFGYGVKFQGISSNIVVGSIIAIGGANGAHSPDWTYEKNIKFQGNSGTGDYVKNITVGTIVSKSGKGAGLYLFYVDGISIGSYVGTDNNSVGYVDSNGDITASQFLSVSINSVTIRETYGVGIAGGTGGKLSIGTFSFTSSRASHLWPIEVGYLNVEIGTASIYRRNHSTTYGSNVYHDGGTPSGTLVSTYGVRIRRLFLDLDPAVYFANPWPQLFSAPNTTDNVLIDAYSFAGYPDVSIVTLSSATSTVVTDNKAVHKHGNECGAILRITAVNAAARALSSHYAYALTEQSAGGGYTIYHPAAAGTETVQVEVLGFKARYYGA